MNYIVAFLLNFCCEETAFWLFSHLIENILPKHFFQKNSRGIALLGFLAEKYTVLQLVKENYSKLIPEEDLRIIMDCLEAKIPQMFLSLMVNTLDFSSSFYLFDSLFTHNNVK